MASTGEVGLHRRCYTKAILKAFLAVGLRVPRKAVLLSTGSPKTEGRYARGCHKLQRAGLTSMRPVEPASSSTKTASRLYEFTGLRLPTATQALDLLTNADRPRGEYAQNFTGTELSNGRRYAAPPWTSISLAFTNSRLASAFIRALTTIPLEQIRNQELAGLITKGL